MIVCADDHGASKLLPGLGAGTYTYGTRAGAMLRATEIVVSPTSTTCLLWEEGDRVGQLSLTVGGRHNLLNAVGAAAAARALGTEWDSILAGLAGFRGVERRFELVGEVNGVTVIDDYAHHPTEIAAALGALKAQYGARRVVAVFQPHLFSRTRDFAREFGEALAVADVVWVTDVFPAREQPIEGVTGQLVVDATREAGAKAVHYVPDLEAVPAELVPGLTAGDVVATLGAGSIEKLGRRLLTALEAPVHA